VFERGKAQKRLFSALDAFSIEHFLPWIHQIMLAYQEQREEENDLYIPTDTKYSKAYYSKKVN